MGKTEYLLQVPRIHPQDYLYDGAVHRQFRKLTKTKGGFPDENSLLKLLYAGILKMDYASPKLKPRLISIGHTFRRPIRRGVRYLANYG